MSRTKNVIKMIFASGINQLIIVIAGLILPPLIISNYGSAVNGLVNSIKQILNYFSIFSVGLGAAGQVALYGPLAKKNQVRINQIMTELSVFLNKMGAVFCFLVGIIAFILPLIRDDGIPRSTIALIVLICGLGSLIEFSVLTKYKILLTADQKQYICSNVNTEGTLLNLVLSVILIGFHASIICVQLVATFAYVVRMCLIVYKIRKIYPFLDLHCETEKKLINNQKEALLYKFTDIISNYVPMTIVMFVCGFKDVSVYTVYNLVFSAIVMIVNIFSNGFSSAFGNQIAEKSYDALRKSYQAYNYAFRTMCFWFYTSAAILIVPFVSVYINNSDGVNYLLPNLGICFALNGLFRAIRTPAITIIDATGRYKENLVLNYCEAIINITISLGLTFKIGMLGVLVGGLISALFRSIFFIRKVNLEIVKISFIKEILLLEINIVIAMILYYVFSYYADENFFYWTMKAIGIACINGAVFILINTILDKKSYGELIKRLKGIRETK